MFSIKKNKKFIIKKKILVLGALVLALLIVTKLPYLNLLFPLWVVVGLVWVVSDRLFRLSFHLKGIFLIALWLMALMFVLVHQEVWAENIAIDVIIFFASSVVVEFLERK